MSLAIIVKNLEKIKTLLPARRQYPEVLTIMLQKQKSLEEEFLTQLQTMRTAQGRSEEYAQYHNWYKHYKGIEEL